MMEGMRKEYTILLFFVFERMNPLPTYLSMEGKDQNAVVRLKDFQKCGLGSILNTNPRSYVIHGRKLNLIQTTTSTMRGRFQHTSEGLTL